MRNALIGLIFNLGALACAACSGGSSMNPAGGGDGGPDPAAAFVGSWSCSGSADDGGFYIGFDFTFAITADGSNAITVILVQPDGGPEPTIDAGDCVQRSDVWTVTGSTARAAAVPTCNSPGITATINAWSLTFRDGSLNIAETITDEFDGGQTTTTVTGTCTQI
jgi:hypothetical protein